MVRKLHEVDRLEPIMEFLCHIGCVLRANAKSNYGRGISKHGVADVRVELVEILVRDGKPNAVLAETLKREGPRRGLKVTRSPKLLRRRTREESLQLARLCSPR